MRNPQDVYHSPPQTPYPSEHSENGELDSVDSSCTARLKAPSSPVVNPTSLPPEPSTLSSINSSSFIMYSDQNASTDSWLVSSFPKISDDNWGTWFSAIESYFLIKDLDGILNEDESAPLLSHAAGTRLFAKRKKHIAGIIGLKLSDPIRELLVTDLNRRDPVALWNEIKSHFAYTKARNRGRVFSKLFSLSCAANEISEFITSAKKTLNELSAIGVHTNSEMITHFLLHLLPPHLESFKDIVIHTAEGPNKALYVDSVINLLQQHVNDKRTQAASSSSNTALSALNNSSSTGPVGRFK